MFMSIWVKIIPLSAEILKKLNDSVAELRTPRNKVAHQEGFSSKNLLVIKALEGPSDSYSTEITKVMSLENIKAMVREEIACKLKPIIPIMNDLVSELINRFESVYSALATNT